jgi:ABC-2 type transport system permease protein
MAVYEHTYRRYEGPLVPEAARFLALSRFTWQEVLRTRMLQPALYAGAMWPLTAVLLIYLHHNGQALELLGVGVNQLLAIDTRFFYIFLSIQSTVSFFIAALAGPGLIAPDLANRALATILARPINRAQYVLGRMLPLAIILSVITWVPGLLLVLLQTMLAGWSWVAEFWRIPLGLFVGGMLWVLVLSLMAMALSAWVRWKPVAGGAMFGIFFILAALSDVLNAGLKVSWFSLLNIRSVMATIWAWLMQGNAEGGSGFGLFRVLDSQVIPVAAAFLMLALFFALCVRLLATKIRGVEVVR